MRLIEADAVYKILESCEIRKATIGNPLTDWEYGYTCGIERAESEIEYAPTVDAIPVSYIRKTSEEWETDGYEESAEALKILLSNWEKENASRKTYDKK